MEKNQNKKNKIIKEEFNNYKDEFEHKDLNIKYKSELVNDSYAWRQFTNSFSVFISINNFLFLIYSTKNKSIICYDLNNEKKISEIKNAHKDYIFNLRHFLDKNNKRDIVLSLSDGNNLKLWNIQNWECICYLSFENKNGIIFSAYLLSDNNINYIIISHYFDDNNTNNMDLIKIFDFNGKLIKNLNNSNDSVLIIYNYYDIKLSTNYIISGNNNYAKSYDIKNNKLYNKYSDNNYKSCNDYYAEYNYYSDLILKNDENETKLIASCMDGNIRIWNFHSGILLQRINLISFRNQYCLCLWNSKYLLVGCCNNKMLLVDYQKGVLIQTFHEHKDSILKIVKINHAKYGECLITQGMGKDQIKIWNIQN